MGTLRQELARIEARLGLVDAETPPVLLRPSNDGRNEPPRPGLPPELLGDSEAEQVISQLFLEYSADLLSLHDRAGAYLWVSRSFTRRLGWTQEQIAGRSAYELFHPDDVERIAEDHARHVEGSTEDPNVRYRLRDVLDDYRWFETRSRATPDGQLIVCITRDVHAEVEANRRRRDAEARRADALRRDAQTDTLTGLPNRRALEDALEREIERAAASRRPLSIAFLDLDRFKRINDLHGHAVGDAVLVRVAETLRSSARTYDLVGRWGGEEFLAVLPATSLGQARVFGERVCEATARSHEDSHEDEAPVALPVTISVGITSSEQVGLDRDLLLRAADRALYEAKRRGRDRVEAGPAELSGPAIGRSG